MRLEYKITDEFLVLRLVSDDDPPFVESEIAIPLDRLHPQGRAAHQAENE